MKLSRSPTFTLIIVWQRYDQKFVDCFDQESCIGIEPTAYGVQMPTFQTQAEL